MSVFADYLTTKNNKTVFENTASEFVAPSVLVYRGAGVMCTALDSAANGSDTNPGRGHSTVLLDETLD